MSQYIPFLDNPIPGRQPGGIGETEKWWVERQEALASQKNLRGLRGLMRLKVA